MKTTIAEHVRSSRAFIRQNPDLTLLMEETSEIFYAILGRMEFSAQGARIFVAMAHASYLAAAQLAISNQLSASYLASRDCLEAGLVAWYLSTRPKLNTIITSTYSGAESARAILAIIKMGRLRSIFRRSHPEFEEAWGVEYDSDMILSIRPESFQLWLALHATDKEATVRSFLDDPRTGAQLNAVCAAAHAATSTLCVALADCEESWVTAGIAHRLSKLVDGVAQYLPKREER